jgi:hypothetical protein
MDRDSYNEVATERVPILRGLSLVAAVVLGLVAGAFTAILFILAVVNIGVPLMRTFGMNHPSDGVFLLFTVGLYAIWYLVLWAIKRWVGQISSALLFLFVFLGVLPLPSIFWLMLIVPSCLNHGGCR